MVLVTLGGCHLLDGLVACDSVEARKEIVRYSGEEIVMGTCGGINPYTLTARLGPGDLAHYETPRGLIQLLGVSRKETRSEDQT